MRRPGCRCARATVEEPDGDPHWWHDPTLYERAARSLAAGWAAIDPQPTPAPIARTPAATWLRSGRWMPPTGALIATVPRGRRKLVTNHDAFGYFARTTGSRWWARCIPSLSTVAEPSAEDVADLIEKIRAEHVRAIFTESSLNPALERADRLGGRRRRSYANLYGDTLGPPGSPGATYIGMERWNMRAMVAGFLGTPPPPA